MNYYGGRIRNSVLVILFVTFLTSLVQIHNTSATTSTITLNITNNISINIAPSESGTFASSTATNNVSVKTNNASGYELGIKASTSGSNNNALINTTDSSKIIPSITESVSEADYSDASYASSHNLNNTWGFKPSKLNSVANTNYIPGPTSTSTPTIIDKTTTANPSTFNDYTITLGTRIDNTQAPGSYANTFVITAVANPTPYTITYNKNTTSTVTNMPANVSSDTFSDQVNLSNLVPARDGFNFKGWCTVQVADGGTCSGTTYNPDGGGTDLTWTLDQTASANSLTLYAMWKEDACRTASTLYDLVACRSKGPQTLAQLRAEITTSNSGVYEYNSSVFGTASDAANTSTIYYYRGILDNTTGSYGSDGDNAAWPNTVLLDTTGNGKDTSDTCWRIVRTTGSGGVKMIYQGKWTGSTCANAETSAEVTTSAFNGTSSTWRQIVRVGYTHNSTYATNTSKSGTIAQVFGTNSNPAANNTRSTIKTYIEDTWYANNMTSYTSKLEASAGYCNDRTMNTTDSWTTPLAESTTIASTYGTSSQQTYLFGAQPRTRSIAQAPSLTCGNKYSQIDRSTVDLYRYVAGSTGVSNQLKYPAALLTADEAVFAGSGYSSSTTPYHTNSFLRSGSSLWLLSPYARAASNGRASGFYLRSNGILSISNVDFSYGVRPAISLKPGSMAVSGSGTAADPWIVNPDPPKYMQDVNQWKDELTTVGEQIIVVDKRDGKEYLVAKQADGNIWMTQNLDLDIDSSKTYTPADTDVLSNWTPSTSTYSTGTTTWNNSATTPESYNPGNRCWNGTIDTSWSGTLDNMTIACNIGNHYHIGNYYNWTAAIAMNDSSSYSSDNQDANQSICPAGWRLPTRLGNKSYDNLVNALSLSAGTSGNIQKTPVYFPYAGSWYGGSSHYVGSDSRYWSSVNTDSKDGAYILYFSCDNEFWTNSSGWKGYGDSVRCVAR